MDIGVVRCCFAKVPTSNWEEKVRIKCVVLRTLELKCNDIIAADRTWFYWYIVMYIIDAAVNLPYQLWYWQSYQHGLVFHLSSFVCAFVWISNLCFIGGKKEVVVKLELAKVLLISFSNLLWCLTHTIRVLYCSLAYFISKTYISYIQYKRTYAQLYW